MFVQLTTVLVHFQLIWISDYLTQRLCFCAFLPAAISGLGKNNIFSILPLQEMKVDDVAYPRGKEIAFLKTLYDVIYKEQVKTYAHFDLESRNPNATIENKSVSATGEAWGCIRGFVWKFRVNRMEKKKKSIFIGLVPSSKLAEIISMGYFHSDPDCFGFCKCQKMQTNDLLHLDCTGWRVDDVVGLEIDNGKTSLLPQ